jgi:metal-sulfur cluster biosynthetic enzyme
MTTMKAVVTAEDVIEELTRVHDPEIGIDIVNLGLIYEVAVEDETARVWMTFTTPSCPVGPSILDNVRTTLESLPLIKQVEITLVWNPPWDLSMMSPQAKAELEVDP